MRYLDEGDRASGEVGRKPLDQFLMRMMRVGDVERGFAQLHGENVDEAREDSRQIDDQLLVGSDDVIETEASRDLVDAHEC